MQNAGFTPIPGNLPFYDAEVGLQPPIMTETPAGDAPRLRKDAGIY
jgi:hypothetical protein